jgi:hypothetical protein
VPVLAGFFAVIGFLMTGSGFPPHPAGDTDRSGLSDEAEAGKNIEGFVAEHRLAVDITGDAQVLFDA